MAKSDTPSSKPTPAYDQPCLRPDLRVVYDAATSDEGPIKIVDPRSDRQYSFDAREHRLCKAANGTAELTAIAETLTAQGHPTSRAEVVEFFRRLHILGLLAPEGTQSEGLGQSPTSGGRGPDVRGGGRRRGKMGGGAATTGRVLAMGARGALKSDGPGAGRASAAAETSNAGKTQAEQATPSRESTLDRIRSRRRDAAGDEAKDATPSADTPNAGTPNTEAPKADAPISAPTPDVSTAQPTPATPPAAPQNAPQDAASKASATPELAPAAKGANPRPAETPSSVSSKAETSTERQADTSAPAPSAPTSVAAPAETAEPDAPAETPPVVETPAPEAAAPEARAEETPAAAPAAPRSPTAPTRSTPTKIQAANVVSSIRATSRRKPSATPEAAPAPANAASTPASQRPAAEPEAPTPDLPVKTSGRTEAADLPASNFFDDDEFGDVGGMDGMGGGGMAGRMGGKGRGGMGGGMAGGGMAGGMGGMGGGMGGGGMAGGMGGGMAGRMGGGGMAGGMGGMGGGGMAGGMGGRMGGGGMGGRMGGGAETENKGKGGKAQLVLFDPTKLFKLFYVLGYPLKFMLWAIVPLVLLAGMTMLDNLDDLRTDALRMLEDLSSITEFMLGLFVVNLFSRLAQGVSIVAHGGKVASFGITLVFNVLPRFFIDRSGITDMDRKGQLWAYGSPLLTRLAIFAIGTLIWAITRESGGWLPLVSLVAAQFGLTLFVVTAFPLMPSDGLRWISVMCNEPKLIGKAVVGFKHVFMGADLPPILSKKDALPLAFLGLGILLTCTLLICLVLVSLAVILETELGGLGVVIFFIMFGLISAYLVTMFGAMSSKGKKGGGKRRGGAMAAGAAGAAGVAEADAPGFDRAAFKDLAAGRSKAGAEEEVDTAISGKAKVVWALIGVVLLVLAFQPYSYEAGGQVEFLPSARGQAVARTDGEIIDVLVREGDIVSRGQVLARLSSWDQEQQVAVTRTQLQASEAELTRLRDGASPEEIEVARRQFESAEASVAFSQAEADRAETLAESGVGSQTAYEKALSTLQSDLANLEVSRASLDLVMAQASETDIAIQQAEIDRLRLELEFAEAERERSQIVASMDGRVVTANLQLLTGSFMRAGDPFLEIENADVISAIIAVPESDIALISPGDVVRLKAWGQSDIEIEGEVQSVAPAAEDEGYGSVIRVTAVFQNPDDFLRSGMTGYAKVGGAEMRAWEAYMRSIKRFFQIEVWSWVP